MRNDNSSTRAPAVTSFHRGVVVPAHRVHPWFGGPGDSGVRFGRPLRRLWGPADPVQVSTDAWAGWRETLRGTVEL